MSQQITDNVRIKISQAINALQTEFKVKVDPLAIKAIAEELINQRIASNIHERFKDCSSQELIMIIEETQMLADYTKEKQIPNGKPKKLKKKNPDRLG